MLTKCDDCGTVAECELWPFRSVLINLCKKCSDEMVAEHEDYKAKAKKELEERMQKLSKDIEDIINDEPYAAAERIIEYLKEQKIII